MSIVRAAKHCANWRDGRCDTCGVPWQHFDVMPDFSCPHFRVRGRDYTSEADFYMGQFSPEWAKQKEISIVSAIFDALVKVGFGSVAKTHSLAFELQNELTAAGFMVVPIVPTDKMVITGGEAQSKSIGSWGEPKLVWQAMLTAVE